MLHLRALLVFPLVSVMCSLAVVTVQAQEHPEHTARAITVRGVVRHVNYAAGTIELQDGHGRNRVVSTTPSTTISDSHESGYEELSDIRPGAHLTVEGSRIDSTLDASFINIRDRR